MHALISADDSWTLWALMTAGTALSLWLEKRYRWADRLSAPVVGMLMAMALSNTRVMPAEAPAYDFIGTWLVPLALPLLLLRANVVKIARETGRLFLTLHISALGTMLGAFAAVALLRGQVPEVERAAAIMAGSYIGGMVNFVAISSSTQAQGTLTGALTVADNLVMAGVFVLLLWMAGSRWFLARYRHPHTADDGAGLLTSGEENEAAAAEAAPLTAQSLATGLAVAAGVVAVAMLLGRGLGALLGPEEPGGGVWAALVRTLLTNKYVLITAVSLATATLLPRWLERLRGNEEVGRWILYLFLFSIGLPADLRAVLLNSPLLFVFCAVMCAVNVGLTLVAGRVLRLPLEDCLISINATIGGPATAAGMAVSRGWPALMLPALLAGLWGYVIGTPAGMLVYALLGGR